ncbi:MAG: PLP-dependent transferase, partial [Achromobacter sp.]|nr:PLP-dependent transferase [Achromobacter sp.]
RARVLPRPTPAPLPAPMPDLRTRLAQAGCHPDPQTAALTPPIHLATTFERPASGDYGDGLVYARWGNPTRDLFEQTLADLEADGLGGGAEGAAFASGMAAAMTVLQTLRPGDHVVLPDDVYHGVRHLLRSTFADWGLTHTEVDQADLDAVRAAIRPETRLVWAETPSNPLEADGDAEEVGRRRARRCLDRGAVLDEALGAAERGGALEQLHARRHAERVLRAPADLEREHPAEPVHLPEGRVAAGVARQAACASRCALAARPPPILLSPLCICRTPEHGPMMPHGKHRHSQSAQKEG